jgi:O-antigen ligase
MSGLMAQDLGLARRRPGTPLAGVFIFIYVVSTVWFATKSSTYLIATGTGFTLAVLFFIEWTAGRRSLHIPAPLFWFAAFICFCTLQMIWAPGRLQVLMTLAQLFVLSAIIVSHEADGESSAIVEYGLYLAVLGTFVFNYFSNEVPIGGRIGSTLENANGYAEVLMYTAILALRRGLIVSLKIPRNYKKLIIPLVFYAASLYAIAFLTGSRKGIILTVVASVLIVWYWIWEQPPQKRILLTIVVAAVFVGIGYGLYQSPQAERLVYLTHYLEGSGKVDHSLTLRADLVQQALDLWQQRPFTGWGLAQFRQLSASSMYAHNNYVELLANEGLIGTAFYVMIYLSLLVSLARSWLHARERLLRAQVFWAFILTIGLVAWDFAAVSYYEKISWIALSVAIGTAVRARLAERRAADGAGAATVRAEPVS